MSAKMTPLMTEFDNLTGEEVTREMTTTEAAQWQADRDEQAALAAQKTQKEAARVAILEKLGLTAEELATLIS